MSFSREEILEYLQQFEAGELTESDFYQQQALEHSGQGFNAQGVLTLMMGGLGYVLLGPMGAIGSLIMGGGMLWGRLQRGREQQYQIKTGNSDVIREALPRDLRVVYVINNEQPTPKQATHPAPTTVTIQPSQPIADSIQTLNLPQRIAEQGVRCNLIIGSSGTAKSLSASQSLALIKQRHPETLVWVASAKCSPDESGYWSNADRLSFFDFVTGDFTVKAAAYEQWLQLLQEFKQLQQPAILLFDELSLILCEAAIVERQGYKVASQFIDEFCSAMGVFSSAGRSQNKAIWGVSPVGAMNGLGRLTKAQIAAFNPIFLGESKKRAPGWHQGTWKDASKNGLAPGTPPTDADHDAGQLLAGMNGGWFPVELIYPPKPDPKVIRQFVWSIRQHPQTSSQPVASQATPTLRDQMAAGIAQGKRKTALLREMGITPGANQAWKDASAIFNELSN